MPTARAFAVRCRPSWVAVALCLAAACAVPSNEVASGTSSVDTGDAVATDQAGQPTTLPSEGNQLASPNDTAGNSNDAANGNGTATTPDAPTSANAVTAEGFALQALDYPGYCLAATAASANATLRLAQCANVPTQSFVWYKGGFAVAKKFCITSTSTVGAQPTLQPCNNAAAAQVWELSATTDRNLVHSITGTPASTGQLLKLNGADLATATVVTTTTASSGLRMQLGLLPGTDGLRIHATPDPNTDLCLTDASGALAAQPCMADQNAQLWRFVDDQLQTLTQRCLVGNASGKTVSLGTCQSTPAANQKWYIMDFFLSMTDPSATLNASSLVLDCDATTHQLSLKTTATSTPNFSVGAGAFF